MAKFILFLDRLITYYLYYIIGVCILSWIPNINPDYPLFNFMFCSAGFYLIPPFAGLSFSPALVMLVCASISMGLNKIYNRFYASKEPKVIIMTKDEFMKTFSEKKEKQEDSDNDSL